MSGSCSSQNNGCSSCAPALGIYAVSASASQGLVGYGCYDGTSSDRRFLTEVISSSWNSGGSESLICGTTSETCNYQSKSSIVIDVDKYGVIFVGINASINSNGYNFSQDGCCRCGGDGCPTGGSSRFTYSETTIAKSNSCEQDITMASDPYGPGNLCVPCDEYSFSYGSRTCSIGCTTITASEGISSSLYGTFTPYPPCKDCNGNTVACPNPYPFSAIFNGQGKSNQILSDVFTISRAYGLCQSSTSTKINLLETNQPQNCQGSKCGGAEGKEDDCWGGAGGFTLYSNNLDDPNATTAFSQKIKFRIAADKETLEKRYESVGGKVIFYTPTSDDVEEGRTPCCNSEDFEGTVHKEVSYSLSPGSKSFKDSMVCQDLTEFDNENGPIGIGIQICYTIDQVKMVD